MRDGDQPPAGVAAEVGDPAVVRAAIRADSSGSISSASHRRPSRRIEDRPWPCPRGRGAATRSFMSMVPNAAPRRYVSAPVAGGSRGSPRARISPRIARSRRSPRLVDALCPSRPGCRAGPARGDRCALAVDLEILEAVVAHPDADRAVAVGGLEVLLPQIRRLEDVAASQSISIASVVIAALRSLSRRRRGADALALHPDARGGAVPCVGGDAPCAARFCTFWVGVFGSSSTTRT